MADTLFQYPGGKSHQFKRIQSIMPDHECFVEGFGGSGTITLNKAPAEVNVYNDLDSELAHFFTVYREVPERLMEWLNKVPYSYETYEDFIDAFYGPSNEEPNGKLPGRPLESLLAGPDDISRNDVKRAGVFFTLRYTQFGAKYQGRSGFGRSKVQNGAKTFSNAKKRLEEFAGCWDHVTIENVSYEKLVDTYDGENTLYYFDPPYIGTEGYYRESDFDHQKFCKVLAEIEGYWIVSYDEIPDELEQYHVSREKSTNFIDSGVKGEGKDTVETLVTNYDPESVEPWRGGQTGLADYGTNTTINETVQQEEDAKGDGEGDGFLSTIDTGQDEEGRESEETSPGDGGFLADAI